MNKTNIVAITLAITSFSVLANKGEALGTTGRVDSVIEYCGGAGYFNERDKTTMQLENLKITMGETGMSMKDVMNSHEYLRNYRNHVSYLHGLNEISFKGECAKTIQVFAYALKADDEILGKSR